MMKSSQKDREWRAGLRLQVGVKSLVSSRLRREESVEEGPKVGAEADSHFAHLFCLFVFSMLSLYRFIMHSNPCSFIHLFTFLSVFQENARIRDTDMSKVKFKLSRRLWSKQFIKPWRDKCWKEGTIVIQEWRWSLELYVLPVNNPSPSLLWALSWIEFCMFLKRNSSPISNSSRLTVTVCIWDHQDWLYHVPHSARLPRLSDPPVSPIFPCATGSVTLLLWSHINCSTYL